MLNDLDKFFKIRGRVVRKSKLKTIPRKGNEEYFFSIIIKDEETAIRANFYNSKALKFYDLVHE